MIPKLKLLALSILLLLLITSVCINIGLIRSGTALSRLLSQKGTVILSPSQAEALLSDLDSGDKVRLGHWRSFIYQFTSYDTNHNVASRGLDDTLELYKANEMPGRSNYFNRMVFQLQTKQETTRLSKEALLGYLGPPDATSNAPGGHVIGYSYHCDGSDFLIMVLVTNGIVARIDICAKPG